MKTEENFGVHVDKKRLDPRIDAEVKYVRVIRSYSKEELERRARLALNKNDNVKWRCRDWGHFLCNLNGRDEVAQYLIDFGAENFKRCKRCSTLNYFFIDQDGNIKFLKRN